LINCLPAAEAQRYALASIGLDYEAINDLSPCRDYLLFRQSVGVSALACSFTKNR
jgi:hypothetical protein